MPLPPQLSHSDVATSLPSKLPRKNQHPAPALCLLKPPHPSLVRLCAQACPGLQLSRLRIKPCQPARFPAKLPLCFSCSSVDEQMSAQLGCSGHWSRDSTELLPCCWQCQVLPPVPCAVTEAALPPHSDLGPNFPFFPLGKHQELCSEISVIVVSASLWEGRGLGGIKAKGDFSS